MGSRVATFIICTSVGLAACADARSPLTGRVERDSAGVTIVENPAPGDSAAAWRLGDTPRVTIGVAQGDSGQELYRVRGAARLSDGDIVVANGGTHELRYFRPDGSFWRRSGRQGDGPGEFQSLGSLRKLPGDTVAAFDDRHRRLSLYDASGRHVRDLVVRESNPFARPTFIGGLADGSLLVYLPTNRLGPDRADQPAGPARDSLRLIRMDAGGAWADTLGVFPGARVTVSSLEVGGVRAPVSMPVAFSATTYLTAGPDVIYAGTSEKYQIQAYAPDGSLRRLIRMAHASAPVTETVKEAYRARQRASRPATADPRMAQVMQRMNPMLADPEFADTVPAFGRLLVDAEQNLWVGEYPMPGAVAQRWTVFDRRGRLLGTVTTPARFIVTDIGLDYLLGHETDDADLERVLLYPLIRR